MCVCCDGKTPSVAIVSVVASLIGVGDIGSVVVSLIGVGDIHCQFSGISHRSHMAHGDWLMLELNMTHGVDTDHVWGVTSLSQQEQDRDYRTRMTAFTWS